MPVITNLNTIVANAINAEFTDAEIKGKYEANHDTNAYTDAEKTFVDQATTLDTTATTLASGVNEVHGELDTHVAATGAHGVGVVVGTNEVQVLTNKVIDDITNLVGADHVHYKVRSSVALAKGTIVKAAGAQPGTDYIVVEPVTASSDVAIGVVHSAIDGTTGWVGLVINTGEFTGTNTSAWAVGTILYVGASGFTTTKPAGRYQAAGFVLRQHSTQGVLLVEFSEPSQAAADVHVTATGNLSATSVQSALEELQQEIDDLKSITEW